MLCWDRNRLCVVFVNLACSIVPSVPAQWKICNQKTVCKRFSCLGASLWCYKSWVGINVSYGKGRKIQEFCKIKLAYLLSFVICCIPERKNKEITTKVLRTQQITKEALFCKFLNFSTPLSKTSPQAPTAWVACVCTSLFRQLDCRTLQEVTWIPQSIQFLPRPAWHQSPRSSTAVRI